ncbi:hypothetical protein DPEC_G00231560 [Dallia pectoralis]|uniref:Uncharacterized protein n=1 Tax=Dallia pectoralis TaxID=75939 RepID=A0ACC2FX17_DALPE|nr:hypothetical protein DPEC_G00231560 [Dallia pectoralis]
MCAISSESLSLLVQDMDTMKEPDAKRSPFLQTPNTRQSSTDLRSGPPLSVFDKLSWTLSVTGCQFVKYPK